MSTVKRIVIISCLLFISLYFVFTKTCFISGCKDKKVSKWMKHVNLEIGDKKSGTLLRQGSVHPEFSRDEGHEFLAKDKLGNPVVLEWEKATRRDESYSKNMKSIFDLMFQVLIEIDLERFRKHPEELYAWSKDFFKDGKMGVENINWDLVKEKMLPLGKKQFPLETADSDEIYIFVKVRDKETKELLGAAIFEMDSGDDTGSITLEDLAFWPKAQGRGLGKLATGIIFKIIPDLKKITLGVYVTNENAIAAYKAMGFTKQKNFWDFLSFLQKPKVSMGMEYRVEKSNYLQKVAEGLELVK